MPVTVAFQKRYFAAAVGLFVIEVIIAFFFHDRFVRPILGDFLVVIFLYCFVQSFFKLPYRQAVLGVLLFSYIIEGTQYFHLIRHLKLQHSLLAQLILGSGFSWIDMLAYTLGALLILGIEKSRLAVRRP